MNFKRHNTAITRNKPSAPVAWTIEQGLIRGSEVFDWGCGRGFDVEYLNNEGFDVVGFDPHYAPENYPTGNFHGKTTVFCNYVLNVIEDAKERKALLNDILSRMDSQTMFVLAVRDTAVNEEAKKKGWRKFKDGYISSDSRKTFQKGFSVNGIKRVVKNAGFRIDWVEQKDGGIFLVLSNGPKAEQKVA
jgi:DNA phosphorothioation-associated putative methyltransferase